MLLCHEGPRNTKVAAADCVNETNQCSLIVSPIPMQMHPEDSGYSAVIGSGKSYACLLRCRAQYIQWGLVPSKCATFSCWNCRNFLACPTLPKLASFAFRYVLFMAIISHFPNLITQPWES